MIPHPRSRLRALACAAIALLAGAAALTGCQSSPAPGPSPEPAPSHDTAGWKAEYDAWRTDTVITLPDMTEEEKLSVRRDYLEDIRPASVHGHSIPELVMWSAPGDWGPQAECMKKLGYSVSFDASGFTAFAGDDFDEQVLNRDRWRCDAQYTMDPRFYPPYTHEQYEVLYTYLTTFYLQCTEGHGAHLDRGAIPPREQWVSDMERGKLDTWVPYDTNTWPDEARGNPKIYEALQRDCPSLPPLPYFLGAE